MARRQGSGEEGARGAPDWVDPKAAGRDGAARKARAHAYYDEVAHEYGNVSHDGWFNRVRRREVEALVRFVAPGAGVTVLDAGCGPGEIARLLTGAGARVTGVDVSTRMLERARPHLAESFQHDIDTLDLGRTFDAVLCSGALEFVADATKALERLAAHVRPGGRLVLLFPAKGFGGVVYAWVQRRRHLAVALQSAAEITQTLGGLGFTLQGSARPFFHCRVLAFRRAG